MVYRFHPALRASLLRALKTALTATEVAELHARAGDILRESGRDEEAVRHYIQAKRFDRIAALIEERKAALLRSGNGESVVRWIQALPPEMRASRPRLQLALAELHRNAGRMASAWQVTRAVCAGVLPQAAHEPELAAQALLTRGMLYYTQGEYLHAREDCEQALARAPEDADDLQIQARFGLVSSLSALNQLDQVEALLSDLMKRVISPPSLATGICARRPIRLACATWLQARRLNKPCAMPTRPRICALQCQARFNRGRCWRLRGSLPRRLR
jgi:LuxR family transcriptional regulator, maltose regulon positive regulatory protein